MFGDASSVSVLDGPDILYPAHGSDRRHLFLLCHLHAAGPALAHAVGGHRHLSGPLRPVKLTEHTETDLARLRQILAEACQQGYAVAVDQLD